MLHIYNYVLEKCKRCGGDIVPIWYRDDSTGKLMTANGKCKDCDKLIAMDDMDRKEFTRRVTEGLI